MITFVFLGAWGTGSSKKSPLYEKEEKGASPLRFSWAREGKGGDTASGSPASQGGKKGPGTGSSALQGGRLME